MNVTRYTISNWERDVCEPCFHELQQLSALFSCNFLTDVDENAVNQEENSRKIRLNPCKQPVIEVVSGENACNFREITVDCRVTGVDQQGNAINFRSHHFPLKKLKNDCELRLITWNIAAFAA